MVASNATSGATSKATGGANKPRKPRKPKPGTFAELAASLVERSEQRSGQKAATTTARPLSSFPDHVELDEFGFDTTTGCAAFDVGEDRLVRRPPGRPPKPR